jgi:hypothetical protein
MCTLGCCSGIKAVETWSWRLSSMPKLRIIGTKNYTRTISFKAWTGTDWTSVELAVFLDIRLGGVSEIYQVLPYSLEDGGITFIWNIHKNLKPHIYLFRLTIYPKIYYKWNVCFWTLIAILIFFCVAFWFSNEILRGRQEERTSVWGCWNE